jgi:hemoglobin-like flavoprotein
MPETVFVSYSHKDPWARSTFEEVLGGGQYKKAFELWFDRQIPTGADWNATIRDAVAGSRIALLLVDAEYLRSDFVAEKELPEILRQHRAGNLTIAWVPVDDIPRETLTTSDIGSIQAIWPPNQPLKTLGSDDLKQTLLHIGSMLINLIKLHDGTSKGLRDDLRPKVVQAVNNLNIELGPAIAAGDYSIFYRAKQKDADLAVKALVPAPGRAWIGRDFIKRAEAVRGIRNSTAIEIRNVVDEPDQVKCVVMNFINAPTLASQLAEKGRLAPRMVADVLAQLVRVAGHLHDIGGDEVIGPVRPSHVHYDGARNKAFISLVPIANETLESCRDDSLWILSAKELSYLSPERYGGKRIDWRTDQYYLGLLALELLNGEPPVAIKVFGDLQRSTDFFKSPRERLSREFRRREPALSFVLARMLECDPRERWRSIDALVVALQEIARGIVPEVVKQCADEHYHEKLRGNMAFFAKFYDALRASSPEIDALFQPVAMEEQFRKLDGAMVSILNFTLRRRTSTLGPYAREHYKRGVKPEHFGPFRDAFLAALGELKLADAYQQEAWRAVLHDAVNYMSRQVKEHAQQA